MKNIIKNGLEPYGAVVSYITCAGRFPEDVNEVYRQDVRRMLPLWGRTEEELVHDVDRKIQVFEEAM